MNNPLLKKVLTSFPDVDAASLPWPPGADEWESKDLELFIGSGGFIKPKKKKTPAPAAAPAAAAAPGAGAAAEKEAPSAAPASSPTPSVPQGTPEDMPAAYETVGYSREHFAITLPVRVHCEDTAPSGHVQVGSLVAFCERARSLALHDVMKCSLADLRERNIGILATEYVVEIVGAKPVRVLDTLALRTTPEFPAAPLMPWKASMLDASGDLYMQGLFGLNMCKIAGDGSYSGMLPDEYAEFTRPLRAWSNPGKQTFSPTALRFFNAYEAAGTPFKPSAYREAQYVVKFSDCDMYNVLFQARVPAMMETCHSRGDASAFYVNIRMSVRPGDTLAVHIFSTDDAALFVCLADKKPVLAAFGHYGAQRRVTREEVMCASSKIPVLLQFIQEGAAKKPKPCAEFDLSAI